MAKKIGIEVKIDGNKEILKNFEEISTKIKETEAKIRTADLGSKELKGLQKDLENLKKSQLVAQQSNQTWLQSLSSAPGALGTLGKSIQGANSLFSSFNMALKTSVFGLIASLVAGLVGKLSEMEGVMDPLEKITTIFSGTMGKLADVVLPPVSAALEGIATIVGKVANALSYLTGGSSKAGDELKKTAEAVDQLNDSNAAFELSQQKANRQLQEAREIAQDSTKPIAERKKALKDAEALEKQIAKDNMERQLAYARQKAKEIAVEKGFSQDKIDALEKADAKQLEAFANDIQSIKGLSRAKSDELYKYLGTVDEIAAQSAKIGAKTEKQINSLTKKDEAAAQKAEEARNKRYEREIKDLEKKYKLEEDKVNSSEKTLTDLLEQELQIRIKKEKLTADEIADIREENAEKIRKATEADQQKALDSYIKNLELANVKAKQITDDANDEKLQAIQEQLAKEEITQEEARKRTYEINKKAAEANLALIEGEEKAELDAIDKANISKEEKAKLRTATELKYAGQERAAKKQINSLIQQDIIATAKEEVKNRKDTEAQTQATFKETTSKLKSQLEEQQALKSRDFQYQKNLLDQIEAAQQKEYERRKKEIQDTVKDEKEKSKQLSALETENTKNLGDNVKARITISNAEKKAKEDSLKLASDALNMASEMLGKNTAAGKAAAIASTTISTYSSAEKAYESQIIPGDPTSVIRGAIAAGIAVAGGLMNVQKILSVPVPNSGGGGGAAAPAPRQSKFATGGILDGASHSDGGIKTPFGELEGGEYVINRRSTQSFLPILDALNHAGNQKYAEGGQLPSMDDFKNMMNSQPAPVVKTYVVASDVVNQAEANKKIQDLSRL